MTRRTVFTLEAFSRRHGALERVLQALFRSETQARAWSDRVRPRVGGLVLYSEKVDPEFDVRDDREVLVRVGDVPPP